MDSEKTKQIVIAFQAIENALKAILKPIKTDLKDPETVAGMTISGVTILNMVQSDCEAIQGILLRLGDRVSELRETIHEDGEIDEAEDMIKDVLFDVQPSANTVEKSDHVKLAEQVFMR